MHYRRIHSHSPARADRAGATQASGPRVPSGAASVAASGAASDAAFGSSVSMRGVCLTGMFVVYALRLQSFLVL